VYLFTSATCLIVYSIRRHRIDDYRGRYRVWLAACGACLLLSANSVVRFHDLLATALSHYSGWSALRDGAIWWLIILGLPLTWIVVRAIVDVKESRLATWLLATSVCGYVVAAATHLGAIAVADARVESVIAGAGMLMSHWFVLAAAVTYARFVVLDAQGLISAHPRITGKRKTKKPAGASTIHDAQTSTAGSPSLLSAADYARRKQQQSAKSLASANGWVDGSRPERDSYQDRDDDESGDGRKLSKSDRKRLRKLKMQNRAA